MYIIERKRIRLRVIKDTIKIWKNHRRKDDDKLYEGLNDSKDFDQLYEVKVKI